MIDNIKLWSDNYSIIKHLDKNFFEERNGIFTKFNNDYTFKLFNPDNNANKAYLRIQINESCTYLKITCSLRKWYYGEKSLQDFSLNDFIEAIELLSSALDIPFDMFCQFPFSMTEIGLNVKVTEKCNNILNMIIGYKNSSYKAATFNGYKRFEIGGFGIKMYDKFAEINGSKSKRTYIKLPNETNFINENINKNWLRVELKITKGKNITKRLGYKTIGEFIANFNDLYLYFWENIQEIQFSEIYDKMPIFDIENKSDKKMNDYFRLVGMHTLGRDIVNLMISKLKNRRMSRKISKILDDPNLKFSTYGKLSFLNNVMGHIVLVLIKSKQTKIAKEIVPKLRANSTYNTIRQKVT